MTIGAFHKGSILIFSLAFICVALLGGDSHFKDGVYKGSAKGYKGPVEVEVTVKDGKISDVKILKHTEDRPKSALSEIPKRIVAAQKTDVDAITGATFSSRGVCKAVDAALASTPGAAKSGNDAARGGK